MKRSSHSFQDVAADVPVESGRVATRDASIPLASCAPFERIMIDTLNTAYELIVLNGDAGDVLLRGGRFPEFCPAHVVSSTASGVPVAANVIEVGLRLELTVDGRAIITSTVQAATRAGEPAGYEVSDAYARRRH